MACMASAYRALITSIVASELMGLSGKLLKRCIFVQVGSLRKRLLPSKPKHGLRSSPGASAGST